jgi:hypothetical protein
MEYNLFCQYKIKAISKIIDYSLLIYKYMNTNTLTILTLNLQYYKIIYELIMNY